MENGLSGFFAGLAALGASILPGPTQDQPAAVPPPEQPAVEEKAAAGQPSSAGLPVAMRLLPPKRPTALVVASAAPASGAPEPRRPEPRQPEPRHSEPPPADRIAPAAPVAAAPSGGAVVLGAPPLPASFQPVGAAAPEAKPVVTAAAGPDAPASRTNEPKRASTAAAPRPVPADPSRIAPSPGPTVLAAAPATAPAPRVQGRAESLSDQEIVERANGFFNNLTTLVADFTQIGGDGRRLGGTIYLQRPGKVRFEYDKPATLEVIADGSSVAVQDTKLATQDVYPISQTPLKFLLRERVNLGQDIRVTGVSHEGDAVRLSLEDRSTLGGTSRITLFFDPQVETLTQWRIVDPQGFQTTVMLNRVDRNRRIDQKLFVINVNRAINNDNPNR
jgi:outer membrane lipoprotein-sorting protein